MLSVNSKHANQSLWLGSAKSNCRATGAIALSLWPKNGKRKTRERKNWSRSIGKDRRSRRMYARLHGFKSTFLREKIWEGSPNPSPDPSLAISLALIDVSILRNCLISLFVSKIVYADMFDFNCTKCFIFQPLAAIRTLGTRCLPVTHPHESVGGTHWNAALKAFPLWKIPTLITVYILPNSCKRATVSIHFLLLPYLGINYTTPKVVFHPVRMSYVTPTPPHTIRSMDSSVAGKRPSSWSLLIIPL